MRPYATRITRLTVAAVLAYLLAQAISPGNNDLTGPLTALLVVQASATGSLQQGRWRVMAVLTGVLVATVVSSWVGLTWWSLGLVVGAALTLGHLLKLGDHILETPISAMLILGAAQHGAAGQTRVGYTLIGAAVGMAFSLAFPPPVRLDSAARSVEEVATGAARVLHTAGEELEHGVDRLRVEAWLQDIHALLPLVGRAEAAIAEARDTRRLNTRALVHVDALPVLQHGVSALDRTIIAVRQTLLALQQEAPLLDEPQDEYDVELRRALAVVLADMGDCITAFGNLTVSEARGRDAEAEAALARTLEILKETRAMLADLLLVDPGDDTSAWLMHGSILSGIEAVLTELDVQARVRRPDTGAIPLRPLLERPNEVMSRLLLENQGWAPTTPAGSGRYTPTFNPWMDTGTMEIHVSGPPTGEYPTSPIVLPDRHPQAHRQAGGSTHPVRAERPEGSEGSERSDRREQGEPPRRPGAEASE